MALPTLEELNQEIAEALAARVAREQAAVNRDAANAAATLAQSEYYFAEQAETVQRQQAESKLQEYITGVELVPVPPPVLPPE